MNEKLETGLTKAAVGDLGFWVIKILATTLAEKAADTVTMTLNWGYLDGVALSAAR